LIISLVAKYFHPGQEAIVIFLIRNAVEGANNSQDATENIAKGIETKEITAALTKYCTGEQVVALLDYLTNKSEL